MSTITVSKVNAIKTNKKLPLVEKEKTLIGVQQNLLHCEKDVLSILEYLCYESNNLHNCAVYYARQMWFKTQKFVTGFDLVNAINSNKHFSALASEAAVQTCLAVGESVKSFSELLKKVSAGSLNQKPRFPGYRQPGGFHLVSFPKRALRLIDGNIRFPLGLQVKAWFGISQFFLPMPSNLKFDEIKEVRILPRNRQFYLEIVYKVQTEIVSLDKSKVLGIDHGVNNWLTCVSNVGTSFIVDGKHLKSINQWYNKTIAKIKEKKPQGFWSNRLATITEKRNRTMRDAVNKAARIVINYCLKHHIGLIVFGWNTGQKDGSDMGKKNNQSFVQVPTGRLKNRLAQLCKQYGIKFVETEESYTSKASFLDSDTIPKFGEKPEGWKQSGKRITRGMYRSSQGILINADCNGAANILTKVAVMLGLVLDGISRGALSAPKKVRLWTLQKSQRL